MRDQSGRVNFYFLSEIIDSHKEIKLNTMKQKIIEPFSNPFLG